MADLSDFFKLIAEEKKKQDEEFKNLVGEDIGELVENIFKPKLKKDQEKKKVVVEEKKEEEENLLITKDNTLLEQSLGLLSEPSDVKQNNDPITPLNQNFVTLDQLNKHYNTFLARIQQQLSTLGGGGEVNLAYMDMPLKSVTSPSYTATLNDYYIGVNYAGAVSITLPKADREGKVFIVKDELGEASRGNNRHITIYPSGTDLIDGEDYAVLAYDYGSLTFVWKGNSWRVV